MLLFIFKFRQDRLILPNERAMNPKPNNRCCYRIYQPSCHAASHRVPESAKLQGFSDVFGKTFARISSRLKFNLNTH